MTQITMAVVKKLNATMSCYFRQSNNEHLKNIRRQETSSSEESVILQSVTQEDILDE